jgi:hypothetical protein
VHVQVGRSIAFCSIAGGQPAVGQIGRGISAQRERCGWDAGRGYVQGQPRISRGSLSIHPGRIEASLSNSKYRSRVAGVKIGHRAPNIGAWTAVIDKKGIETGGPSSPDQEIRVGSSVQDVCAADMADVYGIVAATSVNERIRHPSCNVQII